MVLLLRPQVPDLPLLGLDAAGAALYDAAVRGDAQLSDGPALERLILDRVLEAPSDDGYVSGAAALGRFWMSPDSAAGADCVGVLSLEALMYGQTLRTVDAVVLAQRLYFFNQRPLSAAWRRRLPTPEAILGLLELGPGQALRRDIEQDYTIASGSTWLRFRKHTEPQPADYPAKLYVSPAPADLPRAVGVAIEVFGEHGVAAFKIASTAAGFMRPDKFVAYFASSSAATEAGACLERTLAGLSAQPVPFTSCISPDGLLSIGFQPPDAAQPYAPRTLSWRAWLCQRLATALLVASSAPSDRCEAWRFALHRLQLDGVDTQTWRPM
jgi:hypothetical protein